MCLSQHLCAARCVACMQQCMWGAQGVPAMLYSLCTCTFTADKELEARVKSAASCAEHFQHSGKFKLGEEHKL